MNLSGLSLLVLLERPLTSVDLPHNYSLFVSILYPGRDFGKHGSLGGGSFPTLSARLIKWAKRFLSPPPVTGNVFSGPCFALFPARSGIRGVRGSWSGGGGGG